jgi:hypothetical protein
MKKAILCVFISTTSSLGFGQKVITAPPLPVVTNDTVFLGVTNVVKLHSDSFKIIKASLVGRQVEVKDNKLIIRPAVIGKIVVDITYEDRTEQKTFYSKILPDPRKQN